MTQTTIERGTPVQFSYSKPNGETTRRNGIVEDATHPKVLKIRTDDNMYKSFAWGQINNLKADNPTLVGVLTDLWMSR